MCVWTFMYVYISYERNVVWMYVSVCDVYVDYDCDVCAYFRCFLGPHRTRPQTDAEPSGKHHCSIIPNAKSEARQHLTHRGTPKTICHV